MNARIYRNEENPKRTVRHSTAKIIENKKTHKSIEELFEGFEGEYEPIEIDWGKPVGKEIW